MSIAIGEFLYKSSTASFLFTFHAYAAVRGDRSSLWGVHDSFYSLLLAGGPPVRWFVIRRLWYRWFILNKLVLRNSFPHVSLKKGGREGLRGKAINILEQTLR